MLIGLGLNSGLLSEGIEMTISLNESHNQLLTDPLLRKIRACDICAENLPYAPRPILNFTLEAKILIVGQAPGTKAHESKKPWNDASGIRLREWLGLHSMK